jgi:chromosome partitioning protein
MYNLYKHGGNMELLQNKMTVRELVSCFNTTPQAIYKTLRLQNITRDVRGKYKPISPSGVRRLFEEKNFTYPNKNISIQIVKGGAGKTTVAVCLAVRASHYGARVLAIDLDKQGNLTRSYNVDSRSRPVWLNIIRDDIKITDTVVRVSEYLDLIPSSLNNSRLDMELTQSSKTLKDMINDKLEPIRSNYDLVIMDCPPDINKITASATCASDLIIIPVNPDPYSIDGLSFAISEFNRIKKEFKLNFDFKMLWNKYDGRERLGAVYMHEILKNEEIVDHILPVVIRSDVSAKNAIFDAKTIFDLPRKTSIHEDMDQLAKEILCISQWAEIHRKPYLNLET